MSEVDAIGKLALCAGTRAYDLTYLAYKKSYDGGTVRNAKMLQDTGLRGFHTKMERPAAIRGNLEREFALPLAADTARGECDDTLATLTINWEMVESAHTAKSAESQLL